MKPIVTTAGLVVIVAGLRATASVLIPLVLALFLALITFPLVRWLHRRMHWLAAIALTMTTVLAALIGPGVLIVTTIRQFAGAAPGYEAKLRQLFAATVDWMVARDIDSTYLTTLADPARVLSLIVTALSGAVTLLSVALLVVLVASFMLVEAVDLLEGRGRALPPEMRRILAAIARDMQAWLRVKTIISLATGVAAGVWSAVAGVEFALLWGLLAFLLNYIPTFGSLLAAIPPALIALVQAGPLGAGLVLLGYAVINIAFGSLLEPYLLGRRMGLSPLVVLLSVILWGWTWGPAGMLLAVPITMAIRFGCERTEELRWVASLLGGANDDGRSAAGVRQAAPADASRLSSDVPG